MFTGLVEEVGNVLEVSGGKFVFGASLIMEGMAVGDSVAVNGCCLTVTSFNGGSWEAAAVQETLSRTNLSGLKVGDRVNLERPVAVGSRLGGHVVQGHVDCTGEVEKVGDLYEIAHSAAMSKYATGKGSIAVDGVSLTIVEAWSGGFSVAIIPHTRGVTTLGGLRPGSQVNLEFDILAKYLEGLTRR